MSDDVITEGDLRRFEAIMEEEGIPPPWFWYRDNGEVLCEEENGDFHVLRKAGQTAKLLANKIIPFPSQSLH